MEGNLRFKIDWASLIVGSKFTVFALFYFVFEGNFPSTSPHGGRFNVGFFALPALGAYIWKGLYLEVLIFGILQYLFNKSCSFQGCAVIVQTWLYLKQYRLNYWKCHRD